MEITSSFTACTHHTSALSCTCRPHTHLARNHKMMGRSTSVLGTALLAATLAPAAMFAEANKLQSCFQSIVYEGTEIEPSSCGQSSAATATVETSYDATTFGAEELVGFPLMNVWDETRMTFDTETGTLRQEYTIQPGQFTYWDSLLNPSFAQARGMAFMNTIHRSGTGICVQTTHSSGGVGAGGAWNGWFPSYSSPAPVNDCSSTAAYWVNGTVINNSAPTTFSCPNGTPMPGNCGGPKTRVVCRTGGTSPCTFEMVFNVLM